MLDKIKRLLDSMTLDEKISQLTESWGICGVERLGIPPLFKSETVHGHSYSKGAAIFPQAIAFGASWDRELVRRIGKATAEEAKAGGALQGWSPLLDVTQDIRWGRTEESFGEDKCLVENIGLAWIDGFQSMGMTATPKHFAAHGASLGGRDSNDVGFSERVLRETHYAPFRAAVKKSRVKSIMSAYSSVDGVPATGSRELLVKILREEWGFDGYVMSDVGAPENLIKKLYICENEKEAAAFLVKGGVNLCAPGGIYEKGLKPALEAGLIDISDIDGLVYDILKVKDDLRASDYGFKKQNFDYGENWDCPEHRALTKEAALKSAVLLKNDGILPLDKNVRKVAVIGPAAKSQETGDYSCPPKDGQLIAIYDGICAKLGAERVIYVKGCDFTGPSDTGDIAEAVSAAADADIVVLALGDKGDKTTGENNDRSDLTFTGGQNELLRAICGTGKPCVLICAVGKPVTLEYASENANAILLTWYSGETGGEAIAELLFGDACPCGKLPLTIPKSVSQLPLYYNYNMSGRNYDYVDIDSMPRYRFGFGLSYAAFEYSALETRRDGDNVRVRVDVKNIGRVEAEETVQLYVTDMFSSVATPITSLKGFEKVRLMPDATRRVEFTLTPYELSVLGPDMLRRAEAGKFRVFAGGSSPHCERGGDYRKQNVGYTDPTEGVCGEFTLERDMAAKFEVKFTCGDGMCGVSAVNKGELCDVFKAEIFIGGEKYADRRRELEPNESIEMEFPLPAECGELTLLCGGKLLYPAER